MATEGSQEQKLYVPSKTLDTPYPLIDNDPVFGYARPRDWAIGGAMAVVGPSLQVIWERVSPSWAGPGALAKALRLTTAGSVAAGLLIVAQQSSYRFYGFSENAREREMDMREMVDKIKKGEPLYGKSELSPHMQAVAARNSRYSATFLYQVPFLNFVNHEHHGVDTAKYYQQAERELEAERGAESRK